jgi:hypothetical protein
VRFGAEDRFENTHLVNQEVNTGQHKINLGYEIRQDEKDGAGSGSRPMTGFGIIGDELSDSATKSVKDALTQVSFRKLLKVGILQDEYTDDMNIKG